MIQSLLKKKIKRITIELLLTFIAFIAIYIGTEYHKLYLSAIFLTASFLTSIRMYKKTFPFLIFGFGSYWLAIMYQVWRLKAYIYDETVQFFTTFGDVLIGIGIIYLLQREICGKNKDIML